jgi:gamma-glutamyltranspeptidase / glutathione hydrolase
MSAEFASRRSPVVARNGMVAASQPLAAMAGLRILMDGGNAADAAVATAAALNVTEPVSTGIGGDVFALYYEARTGTVTALNGSGRAPASLSIGRIAGEGLSSPELKIADPFHAHTVTVPGACAAWSDLSERHGSMPLALVLAPAIKLADDGVPVAPTAAYFWRLGAEAQLRRARNGSELTIGGRAPCPGETWRNPGLARTFRTIAAEGKDGFYKGEIAHAVVEAVRAGGGVLSLEDLADHTSTWDRPVHSVYRGLRVWECPPNGQGIAALIALNILEGLDVAAAARAGRLHMLIEALRIAFADTAWYVSDPGFSSIPVKMLLSKEYAQRRRKLIDPARATLDTVHGAPVASSDTVYFCVVDRKGNACSFVNSNYMGFGTGIVPRGWGFSLQNRGYGFSLDPTHPNALAPGKRPYHTIIAGLLERVSDNSLYGPFGVMGGFMQPQGHVQVVVGLVDDGLDPQAALDRPRFCLSSATPDSRVEIEEGISAGILAQLRSMGHQVSLVTGYDRACFGRGQIIRRDPDGSLWGGSDPRCDGSAVGY